LLAQVLALADFSLRSASFEMERGAFSDKLLVARLMLRTTEVFE